MSGPACASRLRFREFELDERTLELKRNGEPVALQRLPARVLAYLANNAGQLVSRDELQGRIWGQLHVNAEQGLNNAVHQIRTALNDDSDQPRYLETLPRAGYRFIAAVERVVDPADPAAGVGDSSGARSAAATHRTTWLSALVALGAALLFAMVAWDRLAPGGRDRGALRLVVLPFDNLTGATLEPLRAVLAEDLITALAQIDPDRLEVIARGSIRAYETKPPTLARVAGELAVDYAVEGSVRRGDERTVIAARLVRVADGACVWSGKADFAPGEALAGTAWLSRQLRDALVRRVVSVELPQPRVARRPAFQDAWEAYLEGRYRLGRNQPGQLEAARAAFERSVTSDPEFAPAWLGLAETRWRGAGDAAARQAAREAVEQALAHAPELAMAHLLRAEIGIYHQWDSRLAEHHYALALALGGGLSEVHSTHGFYLALRGKSDAALREADRARELDPISAVTRGDVGLIYAYAGQPAVAARECARALELDSGALYASECLIDAQIELAGSAPRLSWRAAGDAGQGQMTRYRREPSTRSRRKSSRSSSLGGWRGFLPRRRRCLPVGSQSPRRGPARSIRRSSS